MSIYTERKRLFDIDAEISISLNTKVAVTYLLTFRVSWEMIVEKFTCCFCCFGWWWRQQQHFLISIIEIQLRSLRDVIFPCRSLFLVYIWTSVCRSACKDERGAALVFNIFANKIYIFVLFYYFPLCPTQLDYPAPFYLAKPYWSSFCLRRVPT